MVRHGIPEPTEDVRELLETVRALKIAVETMQGSRGKDRNGRRMDSVPTYQELVERGVLKDYEVPTR